MSVTEILSSKLILFDQKIKFSENYNLYFKNPEIQCKFTIGWNKYLA